METEMIRNSYNESLNVLMKKPWRLLGIILLGVVLTSAATALCAPIPLASLVADFVFTPAICLVCLKAYREEDYEVMDLFHTFNGERAGHIIGGMAWRALWIFVWCLIPIVGPVFGIIRSLEYALVPYILVNEPEISATDARDVSKERMNGHKAELFWAQLAWLIVGAGLLIFFAVFAMIKFVGWMFAIAGVFAMIAFLIFIPAFLKLVLTYFYTATKPQ